MTEGYPKTDAGWFETKASHQDFTAFKSDIYEKINDLFAQLKTQSSLRMETNEAVQNMDKTLDQLMMRVHDIEDMIDQESEWYAPEDEGGEISDSASSSSGSESSSDSDEDIDDYYRRRHDTDV